MNAQLTEIMRLITNLIRTGVVTEVDRENWLCRVKTGDLETNWINWLTLRAGKSRTWWKPSVGEQVVLFSLGGNLEAEKSRLRASADSEIEWRQDAVDAGIATEEETVSLAEWKKYRVLLMRVDTADPDWPTPPATQAS